MSYRQPTYVRIASAPALPALVTRPFSEILKEARKCHDLHRSVPPFWEQHVDRRMATDTRIKFDCDYSDDPNGDGSHHEIGSWTGGELEMQYGPGRWDNSHHRYKLRPRLWPLVLNYVCLLILVLASAGTGWLGGVAFLALYAGMAFIYARLMHDPEDERGQPGFIPPEAWARWWRWHGLLPLALCWSTKEAVARAMNMSGWKRPPFDPEAAIEAIRQDVANRAYLDWARERLAHFDALAASDDMVRHLADMVRFAINRAASVEERYFSAIRANRELSGKPATSGEPEREEGLRQALAAQYRSLETALSEAEEFASRGTTSPGVVTEPLSVSARKRLN